MSVESIASVNRDALQLALRQQGEQVFGYVTEHCPHLFATASIFITTAQVAQMRAVVEAVERVVGLPKWGCFPGEAGIAAQSPKGVFMGYDFHLNASGIHLIEINTNAGGAFLNALLLDSQREVSFPGTRPTRENLEKTILAMFRNEWRLARGDAPLRSIAIVDKQPEKQYLYPEFLLAKNLFERAGIAADIVDPGALQVRDDGLYLNKPAGAQKVDLVYNRLTDFLLQQHPALRTAYLHNQIVLTPHPDIYAKYADKRNLIRLTDAQGLRELGATESDITILQAGIPYTIEVDAHREATFWAERKNWFFKPATGYGGRGTYRGASVTKGVFQEILQGDYIAQRMAPPGEVLVSVQGDQPAPFKFDVRCYVYDGEIQLLAARLYQGQMTNFRTPGGGFAIVGVIPI